MKPVLRYPGAKWRLAEWIISHFPPHTTYLEPFFGSGAVLFNKQRSHCETVNDINGDIVNLFKVIREHPQELSELIHMTPWSRAEYYASYEQTTSEIEKARRMIVRVWQGRSSDLSKKTGWRHDVQGQQGSSVAKIWTNLPSRIIEIAERLRGVQIENQLGTELIQRYKFREVLIYADPPYLTSTRTNTLYTHEMTDKDHEDLLQVLCEHPGPVVLSGYANEIYDRKLVDWQRYTMAAVADKGRPREEVIWLNPICINANHSLFA